VVLGMLTGSLV